MILKMDFTAVFPSLQAQVSYCFQNPYMDYKYKEDSSVIIMERKNKKGQLL